MEKAKVYFTKEITPEAVVKMFQVLNKELPGKIAVKLHSGESGNQNYLHPPFMKPMVEHVNGTVVETVTAYDSARNSVDKHRQILAEHEWNRYFTTDLMDEEPEKDIVLPVENHFRIAENYVGSHMMNYDSMLVLAHFKGHPMGGFGGALKQLAIGCASQKGKCIIHSAGQAETMDNLWGTPNLVRGQALMESMADAASTIVKHFNGNMAFVNIMCNLSVDCDCCAVAEDPCMKDIGILSSLDPVALDEACMDLIRSSKDRGRDHFLERVYTRGGTRTIYAAEELGVGTTDYELICVD